MVGEIDKAGIGTSGSDLPFLSSLITQLAPFDCWGSRRESYRSRCRRGELGRVRLILASISTRGRSPAGIVDRDEGGREEEGGEGGGGNAAGANGIGNRRDLAD